MNIGSPIKRDFYDKPDNFYCKGKVIYQNFDYADESYIVKIILTNHCIDRSLDRHISINKMVDLIRRGMRYVIDVANVNKSVRDLKYKKYTKLISSTECFYLIFQCLWHDDECNNACDEDEYDLKIILVTVSFSLIKHYYGVRTVRAKNKPDTLSFNV